MFLSKIRALAFLLVDFLSGGNQINNSLRDIKGLLEKASKDEAMGMNAKKVEKLLFHAINTTEFYKTYKNYNDLDDFPVIKKSIVQEHFDKFKSKKHLNKKYYKVSTSGSTGVPFFLYQDMGKRNRNTADVIYYLNKIGHNVGDRLYELEVWRNHNKKGKLKSFMQNVYQFDVSKLTDSRILDLIEILKKDRQAKTLLGFASAYETICQFIENNKIKLPIDFNIKSIIANSEYLNDYTRKAMGEFFNAPVFSRYSNEELGLIAHQVIGSGEEFVVNWASYHVELLDFDSDTPVKPGVPGRIVVTDLYNYYMPLIRFDTGDVGVFTDSGNGLPNFKRVEGRKMDVIYDTSGNMVSSFVVYTKFYDYYKFLKQYQFIQLNEKEYLIKLNLIGEKFEYEEKIINDIKMDFGSDAIVNVEYVDEIPSLSSGKRKKVMSLYKK